MNASFPIGIDKPKGDREDFAHLLATLHGLSYLAVGLAAIGVLIILWSPNLLFIGLEMLLLWTAIVAVLQNLHLRVESPMRVIKEDEFTPATLEGAIPRRLSSYLTIWQWVLVLVSFAFSAKLLLPVLQHSLAMAQLSANNLRLAAVIFLVCSAVLYFFTNYAWEMQKSLKTEKLNFLLRLGQVTSTACATASAITFFFLSTERDYSAVAGEILICLTLLLVLEPWMRFAARLFLPKSQQGFPPVIGESVLVGLVFGSGEDARGLTHQFENLLGLKMREMWVVQFMREVAEPIIFAGLLLGWLSTCLTAVPLGSRGVLVSFGRYEPGALEPGLHVSWPWPMGKIEVVETERVREVSLGFDEDLAGPMLWTERHFVGEQNLLVGDGESLLTVDVPIQYRVSDAVAFLKTTSDAPAALKSLAERKLIEAARSRESFQIMTVDRDKMATEIKQSLQAEVNRLGFGLEIVFVGLRDVHPPVDVAPAYERVISAQEQKETTIDLAKVYQASVVPDAQAAAQRLVAEAEAAKTSRVDQATGQAARFLSLVSSEHENPNLFRLRLRYDALDEGLSAPAKIIVGLSGQNLPANYLDLRSGPSPGNQAVPPPPEVQEQPARPSPKELPDE